MASSDSENQQDQITSLSPIASGRNGQRLRVNDGEAIAANGEPAGRIENNNVALRNDGEISAIDANAVQVDGNRARINNREDGVISSDQSAISVSVERANIRNDGEISGNVNAVNFENNGTSGGVLRNNGAISSDSRAVNIGGENTRIVNSGEIIGTGDQRNGTIYTNGSADDFTIVNNRTGVIDAGEGNNGAGVALQIGAEVGEEINGSITNRGEILGRGQAAPNLGTAGDGIRIFAGAEDVTFDGDIRNSGVISSESTQGATAGVRVSNGVNFDGQIINASSGEISGANNGVYFGEGDHDARLVNRGEISSDSRAVNIDGSGVDIVNSGDILGTGDQRNGTIYSDGTADDYSILNQRNGLVDAGDGNNGAGIALQTGNVEGDVVNASIENRGEIAGRGQGVADQGVAGDGIRIFAGAEDVTFAGDITNSGVISSESTQGATAGLRIANGVNFEGTILNRGRGEIAGANNGVYFGTGEHDALLDNRGVISSDSRAVNIDGSGVVVDNRGDIRGTGDQRNGTVYADGTAEDYSILNRSSGLIDAGVGNNGSGVSLQTGDVDGDVVSASVDNFGDVIGRGDAELGNAIGDGVRIFSGVENAVFQGDINNAGLIAASEESAAAVGIRVEDGVTLDGVINNSGTISASDVAIDASDANGANVVNSGVIEGRVLLSRGDDTFDGAASQSDLDLTGGLGDDLLIGGEGIDTVRYDDADVPVSVDLGAGEATRETGFTVAVNEAPLATLTTEQSPEELLEQALANNLYYNIHTNDFNGGEIRGQLIVVSDDLVDGVRVITLQAELDAAQEPGPLSDSEATGQGTVVIRDNGGTITYSSTLTVIGLAVSDLLPVAGVSSIHLHNAPAGQNGPVITDIVQDAGGDVNGLALSPEVDTGDGDVFVEAVETDTLVDIENVVGSIDGDNITGDGGANLLEGLDGDDVLSGGGGGDTLLGGEGDDVLLGGGGADVIDGGEGIDTNSFANINANAVDPTIAGVEVILNANGSGTAEYIAGGIEGNPVIFEEFTGIENIEGTVNDDVITATGEAENVLSGGLGDDLLTGGGGADTFIFTEDNGVDIITDFEADLDVLDFTATGAGELNAVQQGDDVVIDLGEGNSVTLLDTLVTDITDDNALF